MDGRDDAVIRSLNGDDHFHRFQQDELVPRSNGRACTHQDGSYDGGDGRAQCADRIAGAATRGDALVGEGSAVHPHLPLVALGDAGDVDMLNTAVWLPPCQHECVPILVDDAAFGRERAIRQMQVIPLPAYFEFLLFTLKIKFDFGHFRTIQRC